MADYKIEETVTSVLALLSDVTNTLLLVALKNYCSPERRRDVAYKLRWAAEKMERIGE